MDRKSTSMMEGVREAICTSSSALSSVLPSLPAQREARTWVLRDHHGQPQGTPTMYPSCLGKREKRSHFSFERVLRHPGPHMSLLQKVADETRFGKYKFRSYNNNQR